MTLWKAAGAFARPPTDGGNRAQRGGKSLRSRDRGGAVGPIARLAVASRGCASVCDRWSFDDRNRATLRTPLHALHVELGARMAPFAGYDMPIQYPTGILAEHLHTRAAGRPVRRLAHGPGRLEGPDHATVAAALERLCPADILRSRAGASALHAVAQRRGRHDRRSDGRAPARAPTGALILVVNAARKEVISLCSKRACPPPCG